METRKSPGCSRSRGTMAGGPDRWINSITTPRLVVTDDAQWRGIRRGRFECSHGATTMAFEVVDSDRMAARCLFEEHKVALRCDCASEMAERMGAAR